jgi:hypothetical protein
MVAMVAQPNLSATSKPSSRLEALARVASELELVPLASEVRAFAERVAQGRFYVACVGQFKRGKSSLLNALLTEPVLPAGVVPVTSIVTIVRHGGARFATIHKLDGATEHVPLTDLGAYVTESGNPANREGISAVEVVLPNPLLEMGMCLVDTPGLGSVFTGSTARTKAFVPHIDAALVVLGADPPLAHDELELIAELADSVAYHPDELILVLNKADRLTECERLDASRFAAATIAKRLGRPIAPLLEVSAAERLAGRGPARDWDALTGRLATLAENSGATLVRAAEARGVELFGRRLLHEVEEREGALVRPIEETQARIGLLERSAVEAERALSDVGHLSSAEQERLHRGFASRQEEFLARTWPSARAELETALRAERGRSRAALWRRGNELAQDLFRRHLETWRAEEQPVAEEMYRRAARRFTELANHFLEQVRSAGEGFSPFELPPLLGPETGFRTPSRLYFTQLLYTTTRPPFRWLFDLLRTRADYENAVARHALTYLERLIRTNASRVTNALDDQVVESRRRLERDVRDRLRDTQRVARRALDYAEKLRVRGDAASTTELDCLEASRARIEGLLASKAEVS